MVLPSEILLGGLACAFTARLQDSTRQVLAFVEHLEIIEVNAARAGAEEDGAEAFLRSDGSWRRGAAAYVDRWAEARWPARQVAHRYDRSGRTDEGVTLWRVSASM